ncbi:MAG: hypothetical protein PHH11_02155 [Methylomonas sp.]|nr:hypothetical protein [Methylomonas sp.]
MKLSYAVYFACVLWTACFPAHAASNYQFEPGDTVLTNCRQIYTKGTVIARVDDGYTIHFPKKSGPINCPPFRWHAEFVQPFQSVQTYKLQFFGGLKRDLVFRVGETVTLRFEADKRIVKNKNNVDIEAEITDISDNGAIAVKLLSADPESAAMFWKFVGNNYVDLRHAALAVERDKR